MERQKTPGRRLCCAALGAAPAFWLGALLLTHSILPPTWVIAAAGALALLMLMLPWGRSAPGLALVGFALAFFFFSLYRQLVVAPIQSRAGWSGTLTCQVTDYAQGKGSYGFVEARVTALGEEKARFPIRLYLEDASPDYAPGQTIQVEGRLRRAPLEADRGYAKQGVFLLADQVGSLAVLDTGKPPLWSLPRRAAHGMAQTFSRWLPQREAALITGITTGNKNAFTPAQRRDLNLSGTSHLTAVSGLHVSVLLSLCVLLLGRRWGAAAGLPLCLGYVLLAGATPSAVRAAIMACFPAGALFLRRDADTLTALSAALLLILLFRPVSILDVGLQLSFSAALGLVLFFPSLKAAIDGRLPGGGWRMVCRGLLEALAASGCALVLSLPISSLVFSRVSMVSLLSNLLIVPLLPFLLVLGLGLALAGLRWAALAKLIALPLHCLLWWVDAVQRKTAALPFSSAMGGSAFLVLFALLAAGAALLFWKRREGAGRGLALVCLAGGLCLGLGGWEQAATLRVQVGNCGGSALVLLQENGAVTALCAGPLASDDFYQMAQTALDRMGGARVDTLWLTSGEGVGLIDQQELHWAQVGRINAPDGTPASLLLGEGAKSYSQGGRFGFHGGKGALLPCGGAYALQVSFPRCTLLCACGTSPEALLDQVQQTGARADFLVVDAAYAGDLPRLAAICRRVQPQALVCIQPSYNADPVSLGAAFGGRIIYLQNYDSFELTLLKGGAE